MVKNLPIMPARETWVGKSPWRREQQPTPVFLPGEAQGQRGLGATAHGVTKSDTTEKLSTAPALEGGFLTARPPESLD